jgi:ABC-2 type transport system permease protein
MRKVLALVRASWLTALSYRLNMVISVGSLLVTLIPLYFIAHALQPTMGSIIRLEGTEYFGFVLVGTIAYFFVTSAVTAVPGAVTAGIGTGTLEALLSTPTSLPVLLTGMTGYGFIWAAVRAVVILAGGWVLGAHIVWDRSLAATGILALIVVAYLPFGILTAALVLAFRTTGSLPQGILVLSGLLGGVYYPTRVIPAWIQQGSAAMPLTYGLRALRRVLLDGAPLAQVASDLEILVALTGVLLVGSIYALVRALRYARRSGTLTHY